MQFDQTWFKGNIHMHSFTDALDAAYECRGDELYVRAVVISDRPHPMPTIAGNVMKAWTQPLVPKIRPAECA